MTTPDVLDVLGTGDVAKLFHVDPRTVAKWVRKGQLPCFRTPGGHLRFHRRELEPLVEAGIEDEPEVVAS